MTNCQEIIDYLKDYFPLKTTTYNYDITSSNYTPNIDGTVTITVTVTDGNNNPVNNHTFNLNVNGTDEELTTNSSGVATYTYTCSTFGVSRFNVDGYDCIIKVGGFKTYDGTYYTLYYNEDACYMEFSRAFNTTFNANATWTEFTSTVDVPSALRPAKPVISITGYNGLQILFSTNGKVSWANRSGSNISSPNIQFSTSWRKQ